VAVPRLIIIESIRALGWPGLLGAALLLAGLVAGLGVLMPANQERQQASLRAAKAKNIQARVANGELATPETPESMRTAFYRDFPAQGEVTRWIERIYDAAAGEQLSLARGEYALTPLAGTRLTRYQISLPVRGDYERIRRFINAALAAVPSLALDDLSLQRQEIGDAQVEARIRLSLYLVNS
jgi:Tfp pilus assembly protein PilO